MKTANELRAMLACGLMLAAALPALAQGSASLRVAYLGGPAGDALHAGKTSEAIDRLTAQLADEDYERHQDDRATLCAAYILERDFGKAKPVCDEAVQQDGTEMAFNNRGVLRAHLGDFSGAMQDFARIRVAEEDIERYLQQLAFGNARMIATSNFELIERIRPDDDKPGMSLSRSQPGAEIEDIGS